MTEKIHFQFQYIIRIENIILWEILILEENFPPRPVWYEPLGVSVCLPLANRTHPDVVFESICSKPKTLKNIKPFLVPDWAFATVKHTQMSGKKTSKVTTTITKTTTITTAAKSTSKAEKRKSGGYVMVESKYSSGPIGGNTASELRFRSRLIFAPQPMFWSLLALLKRFENEL